MTQSRTPEDERVREQFYHHYAQWQIECEQPEVRIMSDATVFISLPSYRAMVDMGRPALPYLQDRMEHDSGFDFMLVYAAMEIEGWKETDFPHEEGSVQEDRDHVLARMKAEQ